MDKGLEAFKSLRNEIPNGYEDVTDSCKDNESKIVIRTNYNYGDANTWVSDSGDLITGKMVISFTYVNDKNIVECVVYQNCEKDICDLYDNMKRHNFKKGKISTNFISEKYKFDPSTKKIGKMLFEECVKHLKEMHLKQENKKLTPYKFFIYEKFFLFMKHLLHCIQFNKKNNDGNLKILELYYTDKDYTMWFYDRNKENYKVEISYVSPIERSEGEKFLGLYSAILCFPFILFILYSTQFEWETKIKIIVPLILAARVMLYYFIYFFGFDITKIFHSKVQQLKSYA